MIRFEELTAPIPAPANLLPTGLPDLIPGLQQEGTLRSVLYQLQPNNPAPSDTDASIGALGIAEFETDAHSQDPFSALVPTLQEKDAANLAAQITLGPRIPNQKASLLPSFLPEPQLQIAPRASLADIGIIDAGICFWNPTFWNEAAGLKVSRFASFGGLKLSGQQITHDWITREKIEQLLEKTEAEIRDDLANAFPGSVYSDTAPAPLFPANRLAHGTAMAELVTSSALAINNLHGLELPVSVLRDLTGGLMSAVLEMALRAMIEQMIETAKEQARSMVILMAFGFTGGPLNGNSKVLEGMKKVLDSYRSKGHQVTLVLPIGNHLQDRLHAHLEEKQDVIWRIQPDDHSANTVEIIHPQTAELHLAAPNGEYVRIPSGKEGLHRIVHDETPVGACWTTVNQLDSSMQTRIALLPTAITRPNVPLAPPGQWHLNCKTDHADLWILRDERGFEPDPFQPTRASWFEDSNYREKDDTGEPARTDAPLIPSGPNPVVKRQGSASVLASSKNESVLAVTAEEDDGKLAYYASLLPQGKMQANNGHAVVKTSLSQNAPPEHAPIGPFVGRAVLGNGGPDRFRVLGTSLAAALAAGTLAARLSGSKVEQ